MSETREPILTLEDLKVWFPVYRGVIPRHIADVKAVDGVSVDVLPGETLGVVGESGCGKSTLGKAIMGLVKTTSGKINFTSDTGKRVNLAGMGRREIRPFRREIQMVYQDPYSSLNPRLSVEEIVAEPLSIHQKEMKPAERRDKVAWLLEKVGLNRAQMARYPHEFSGGQRQRIGIARALATNPRLIIADEPVSALDVSIQAQVINLLMDLQDEFGLTFIFIAHDLSVVEHISKRIAVMYLGNVVEIGTTEELMSDPKHPYTRALLSAVPRPDPDLTRPDRISLKGDVPSPMQKPSGCGFRTRCPLAQPDCAEKVPDLTEFTPGHWAACPYADAKPSAAAAGSTSEGS